MYRVLFLGWEYYPVFTGGLGIVCTALAEEMASQELEVYVVLPALPKQMPESQVKFVPLQELETAQGKSVKVFYTNVPLDPYASEETDSATAGGPYRKRKAANSIDELYGTDLYRRVGEFAHQVGDLAAEIEFDIIHAHDWMTFSAAINAQKVSGKKAVLHIHATEFDRTADNPNQFILNIEKTMLHAADMVLAVSAHTKQTLINKYALPADKIKVLHNALSPRFSFKREHELNIGGGKTVIFLGRVVVQKGVENFIYIARKIVDMLPNTNFIFAGDGALLNKAIELTAELNLQDNFIFTGFVNREQGDILYNNADLYIMTSGSEPFGITALEAIIQDTPVIVPITAGVNEVLPNAIKIDFWDVDKFADYAINLLSDDTFHDFLLQQQHKDIERLSWKSQVEKLIQIYDELVKP